MKKLTALFLCVSMLLACVSAFAESQDNTETDGSGQVHFFESNEESTALQESVPACEPYVPGELEKAVIGADNRVTVNNTSQWPYSAIAMMDVVGECGDRWSASGFLVGDKGLFLTAAHCLVCSKHSKWANNINFYFGYKSSKNYLYKYNGRWDAWVGNLFSNRNYSIEKDYAVVNISSKVPEKVGYFGAYWADSDTGIQSYYAYVAGYRDGKLRYDSGFLSVLDSDHVKYVMDDVAGNSGGPIYTSDGYAIGIIIADSSDRYGNPVYNIGYRLTYEVWKKAEEYRGK